jgi:hypothetical protein
VPADQAVLVPPPIVLMNPVAVSTRLTGPQVQASGLLAAATLAQVGGHQARASAPATGGEARRP